MGLYERLLEEAAKEERSPVTRRPDFGSRRGWNPPAPGAGCCVTVEDLEWEEERREQERIKVQQEKEKRSKEIRILRTFARQGVHSMAQVMAFKSLQRKYPAEWATIRWK